MTYCVELWGNTYKTNVNPVFILQKRVIRIIKRAAFREPTNPLFIDLQTLKFWELVKLQTLLILYKAHNNLLPYCLQKLFQVKETKYELRNADTFASAFARTNTKQHCVTVKGVNLWKCCDKELRTCSSIHMFKKRFKNKMINEYRLTL